MQPLILNTNSWHYKVAMFLRDRWWEGGIEDKYKDICSYSRLVFFKLFTIVLLFAAGFFLVSSVYDAAVYFLIGWIFNAGSDYYSSVPALVAVGITILGILSVIAGIFISLFLIRIVFIIIMGLVTFPVRIVSKSKPGFISEAYKAFKEKTCIRINFEDHESKD